MNIALITLGCDKNTVDSEYIAGILKAYNYSVYTDVFPDDLAAVIINTCGFIKDAQEQSIDEIMQWVDLKNTELPSIKIIVYGCLAQRFGEELAREIPEIDAIVGVGELDRIPEILISINAPPKTHIQKSLIPESPEIKIDKYHARIAIDGKPYSFLKIADGCSYSCSFCAIPSIKGPYCSVPSDILLKEAELLLNRGVKEINIVAQDIGLYGKDLKDDSNIISLLKDLCGLKGDFWIRLLYLYPSNISDELIQLIANEPKICKYIDMPIQHIDDEVLENMHRRERSNDIKAIIKKLRDEVKDITIRTTIIVGFPGETEEAFKRLFNFVKKEKIDRLGVFGYSKEEGTHASKLKGKVSKKVISERMDKILRTQSRISLELNTERIGKTYTVLIEEYDPDKEVYISRSQHEAPEVDGLIFVKSEKQLELGTFTQCVITDADVYDLLGESK